MKQIVLLFLITFSIFAGNIKIPASFSAKFKQKITSAEKKTIKYNGSMLLNSTGELKWSYKKPTKKEVCSNGISFTIVDHDLEQVSYHTLDQALDLVAILREANHHRDNLYTASYQNVLYTFALDKKGRITQIAYKDTHDNVINIHFQGMKYKNKPNSTKKMKCPYPKSYDIING